MRFVASASGLERVLGAKGEYGILQSMATRAACLRETSHPIVFHDTPTHASGMNRIERWCSILVRKLLTRGQFTSVADLKEQLLRFIAYFLARGRG